MAIVTVPQKLTKEVKTFIIQAVAEILNDPDFGLELNEQAKKRLRRTKALKRQKAITFAAIRRKYY